MVVEEDRTCSNCGTTRDVRLLSFEMDLPPVRLCGICSYAIMHDHALFDAMGGKPKNPRG